MAEIEKLIERLEKLTGPCRKTDANIAEFLGYSLASYFAAPVNGEHPWYAPVPPEKEGDDDFIAERVTLPRFTSSIDAALTLVTNGLAWACAPHWDEREHRLYKPYDGRDPKHRQHWPEWQGIHKHDAIALCIAALKARAALEKDSENEG